jgi:hypothetical protein
MKLTAIFLLFLLMGIMAPLTLLAQGTQPSITDAVELKDGKILHGTITSYQQGGTLLLRQENGEVLEILDADIARIRQGTPTPTSEKTKALPTRKPPVKPKTKSLYMNSMLLFAVGNGEQSQSGDENNEDLTMGAGFSQTIGYQFSRSFGAGLGVAADNYSRRGETVYPLFAEARLSLPSKKPDGNFYLLGAGGFGFAFKRKTLDIAYAEGGPMYFGAFGYRALTLEGLDVNVDLGYRYQQAHWERWIYSGDLEVRDVDYRRVCIRVGLTFW